MLDPSAFSVWGVLVLAAGLTLFVYRLALWLAKRKGKK